MILKVSFYRTSVEYSASNSLGENHIHASVVFCSSEDSDYNPADEDSKGRPPALLKKPTHISSSSQGRPRRKVGRPVKYSSVEEGYSSKGAFKLYRKHDSHKPKRQVAF